MLKHAAGLVGQMSRLNEHIDALPILVCSPQWGLLHDIVSHRLLALHMFLQSATLVADLCGIIFQMWGMLQCAQVYETIILDNLAILQYLQ